MREDGSMGSSIKSGAARLGSLSGATEIANITERPRSDQSEYTPLTRSDGHRSR